MNVQSGPRPPIVDVQLTQLDAEAQGLLDERPAVRTGVPYDKAAMDRELQRWTDRMRGRGYYEARASHGVLFPPDGAVLSVSVTRGPHITVAFAGDDLDDGDRERLVPIRAEASADEDLLEDSARAIEVFLRGRGYRQARTTYTRTPGPREVVITFDVRRGPHFVFGSVDVIGATALTPAEVREFLLLKEGEPFTEAALGAGVAALRNAYLGRGFALVTVEPSEAVVAPETSQRRRTRQRHGARHRGPPHRGADGRVRGAAGGARGHGARLRAAGAGPALLVRASWRSTATASTSSTATAATTRCRCAPTVTRAENDTQADVRYRIEEGPQVLVDRVIIVGNTRTSPRPSNASCW